MILPRRPFASGSIAPGVVLASALAYVFVVLLARPSRAVPNAAAIGKPTFDRACGGCHQIGLGAANSDGPQLNGLIGAPAGVKPGYAYSAATARSGVVWTKTSFLNFIADPRASMPGTRMVVPGVALEADRRAIFAYVERFAADGTLRRP